MRPYLAIIRDSFHAAFASRILWIVLVAIVFLLLALAPVGYQEVFTVDFSRSDINSTSRLTDLLTKALESKTDTAAKQIATSLPPNIQKQILESKEEDKRPPRSGEYVDEFNNLIENEGWYDAELWKDTVRLRELRELDEVPDDEIEERLKQRRARLRIEAALPNAFRPRPNRSIQVTYGWLETPIILPLRKDQFAEILNQAVYPTVLNLLLGVGAVFVGVLVTSPIIPDMFQPGSLHLLLSKPISRPALYLSKFVGGCAFVFLCVSVLVAGLWLISGTRLNIWNHRLFYSIPVFVFLFAVYYSVSALAGLHWRSPVVSVAVTVVFWFLCFIVGTFSNIFDGLVADPARVQSIASSNNSYLISTQNGSLFRVDVASGEKTPLFESAFGQPPRTAPIIELQGGRIASTRSEGGMGQFSDKSRLVLFEPGNDWKELPGIQLPDGTQKLIPASDGGLLAISVNGIFYAPGDKLQADPDEDEDRQSGGFLGGLQRFLAKPKTGFTPILPESFSFFTPAAVTSVPTTGDLIVYSGGTLSRLTRQTGSEKWSEAAKAETEGDNTANVQMASTSQYVLITRKDEPLRVYNTQDLQPVTEVPMDETYAVVSLKAAPDETYALANLSNKSLLKISLNEEVTVQSANLPYQDDVESIGWTEDNRLLLAHDIDQVTAIDMNGDSTSQVTPERDLWRNLYAWVVTPLRNIMPQTGEVGEIVIAAICGRSNIELLVGDRVERQQLSVIRPLATCGGFAACMLLLGCFYVYRQDF